MSSTPAAQAPEEDPTGGTTAPGGAEAAPVAPAPVVEAVVAAPPPELVVAPAPPASASLPGPAVAAAQEAQAQALEPTAKPKVKGKPKKGPEIPSEEEMARMTALRRNLTAFSHTPRYKGTIQQGLVLAEGSNNITYTHAAKYMLVPKQYGEEQVRGSTITKILTKEGEGITVKYLKDVATNSIARRNYINAKEKFEDKHGKDWQFMPPHERRFCDKKANHSGHVLVSVDQEGGESTMHLSHKKKLTCILEETHLYAAYGIMELGHTQMLKTKAWIGKEFDVNDDIWECMVMPIVAWATTRATTNALQPPLERIERGQASQERIQQENHQEIQGGQQQMLQLLRQTNQQLEQHNQLLQQNSQQMTDIQRQLAANQSTSGITTSKDLAPFKNLVPFVNAEPVVTSAPSTTSARPSTTTHSQSVEDRPSPDRPGPSPASTSATAHAQSGEGHGQGAPAPAPATTSEPCLLYTSDAADE